MIFSFSAVRAEETPEPENSSHVQEKTGGEKKTPEPEKNEDEKDPSEEASKPMRENTENELRVVKEYDLWVSGVRVNEENKADILKDGTASYEENAETSEKILTLKSANLEVKDLSQDAGEAVSAAIYTKDVLTIRMNGESSIRQSEAQPEGNLVTGIRLSSNDEKTLRFEGVDGGSMDLSVSANTGKDVIGISINAAKTDAGQMLSFFNAKVSIQAGASGTAKTVKGVVCNELHFSRSTLEISCAGAEEVTGISLSYTNIDDSNVLVRASEADKAYGIFAHKVGMLDMSGVHIIGTSNIVLDASKSTSGIGAYEEAESELLVFDQSTLEVSGSDKAVHFTTVNDKEDRGALVRKTLSESEIPVCLTEDLSSMSDQYCYAAIPMNLRTYVVSSADARWIKDSGKPARFTWKNEEDDSRTFSHFASVMFDKTELDPSCYFYEEGSLKLALLPAFLESQPTGTHTVQAVFSDGISEEAEFIVEDNTRNPDIYTESADKEWDKGSEDPAQFVWKNKTDDSHTYQNFIALRLDGTELDPSCYTKEEGSIKIQLLPEFLETLKPGRHTVQALFSDGVSEEVKFTIEGKSSPTSKPAEDSSSESKTQEKGTVITCQMAGYPQGYEWNEAAKACQMGTLDAQGKFHPASANTNVRKQVVVNTSDKGIRGSLMTFIIALAAALWSGSRLWKYR